MKFRRITNRSKISVPCIMAKRYYETHGKNFVGCIWDSGELDEAQYWANKRNSDGSREYTYWMPFQWPEEKNK